MEASKQKFKHSQMVLNFILVFKFEFEFATTQSQANFDYTAALIIYLLEPILELIKYFKHLVLEARVFLSKFLIV